MVSGFQRDRLISGWRVFVGMSERRFPILDPCHASDNTCRVVMLGVPGVGKTALTARFITKRFIGEYCPTLEDIYTYYTTVKEDNAHFEIFDTAGGLEGSPSSDMYALWGNCFIYVYSIEDRASFNAIMSLKHKVDCLKLSTGGVSALVGNKIDLELQRQVSTDEGRKLAKEISSRFFEVSASEGDQLEAVINLFQTVYRDYRQRRLAPPDETKHKPRKHITSTNFRKAISKVIIGRRFIQTH